MGQKVWLRRWWTAASSRREICPQWFYDPKGECRTWTRMRSSPGPLPEAQKADRATRRAAPKAKRMSKATSTSNALNLASTLNLPLHHAELHSWVPPRITSCARRSRSATWCCAAMPPTWPRRAPGPRPGPAGGPDLVAASGDLAVMAGPGRMVADRPRRGVMPSNSACAPGPGRAALRGQRQRRADAACSSGANVRELG